MDSNPEENHGESELDVGLQTPGGAPAVVPASRVGE